MGKKADAIVALIDEELDGLRDEARNRRGRTRRELDAAWTRMWRLRLRLLEKGLA